MIEAILKQGNEDPLQEAMAFMAQLMKHFGTIQSAQRNRPRCAPELNYRGFRGREYNANNIGKTMRKLGFESKVIHGTRKYLVVKVDFALHTTENKEDAKEFIPDIF